MAKWDVDCVTRREEFINVGLGEGMDKDRAEFSIAEKGFVTEFKPLL